MDQVFIGGSSSHEKSKVAQLLGTSIVPYVEHHCKVPVTVVVKEAAQGTVQRHTNN